MYWNCVTINVALQCLNFCFGSIHALVCAYLPKLQSNFLWVTPQKPSLPLQESWWLYTSLANPGIVQCQSFSWHYKPSLAVSSHWFHFSNETMKLKNSSTFSSSTLWSLDSCFFCFFISVHREALGLLRDHWIKLSWTFEHWSLTLNECLNGWNLTHELATYVYTYMMSNFLTFSGLAHMSVSQWKFMLLLIR